MRERVQKILARAGVDSRRKCELLIEQGKVKVNGNIIKLGDKADLWKDKIVVDGKQINLEKRVYILLNKPVGYVSTVKEQHGMKTIMDLVNVPEKIFPVGRLDKNTEGLLLLTNDGDLTNLLTHPRYGVEKEYNVFLNKHIPKGKLNELRKGLRIDDRKVRCEIIKVDRDNLIIRIHEGRKHIVRKLFAKLNLKVVRLVRTKIATLKLNLMPGKWQYLDASVVDRLRSYILKNVANSTNPSGARS